MAGVRDADFESEIHAWEPREMAGTVCPGRRPVDRAPDAPPRERFEEIFGEPARAHGAAGWQTNLHALRLNAASRLRLLLDTRGAALHPVWRAEICACPQLPATLPNGGRVIGTNGLTPNVAEHVLGLTAGSALPRDMCIRFHGRARRRNLAPAFEAMLAGWKKQRLRSGIDAGPAESLDLKNPLPRNEISVRQRRRDDRDCSPPGRDKGNFFS